MGTWYEHDTAMGYIYRVCEVKEVPDTPRLPHDRSRADLILNKQQCHLSRLHGLINAIDSAIDQWITAVTTAEQRHNRRRAVVKPEKKPTACTCNNPARILNHPNRKSIVLRVVVRAEETKRERKR